MHPINTVTLVLLTWGSSPTPTTSKGLLNGLADFKLDNFGLLAEICLSLLRLLSLLLLSTLSHQKSLFKVRNPGLCCLELLLEKDDLVLMALHQLVESLLMVLVDLGDFTVEFLTEIFLQLLLFLSHFDLMLFEHVIESGVACFHLLILISKLGF